MTSSASEVPKKTAEAHDGRQKEREFTQVAWVTRNKLMQAIYIKTGGVHRILVVNLFYL